MMCVFHGAWETTLCLFFFLKLVQVLWTKQTQFVSFFSCCWSSLEIPIFFNANWIHFNNLIYGFDSYLHTGNSETRIFTPDLSTATWIFNSTQKSSIRQKFLTQLDPKWMHKIALGLSFRRHFICYLLATPSNLFSVMIPKPLFLHHL